MKNDTLFWQLTRLSQLAEADPDRVQSALDFVWEAAPDLYEDVVVSAVAHEHLSISEAVLILGKSEDEVMQQVLAFRNTHHAHPPAIEVDAKGIARLVESKVAVWEIVREYRKSGSVDSLADRYPSLTRGELVAALQFAETHEPEIERNLAEYEALVRRKQAEYPSL